MVARIPRLHPAWYLLFLPILATGFLWWWIFHGVPYDDAFIYYRYARNLVAGHGLTFNPGEKVEGFTGFLWLLVQALVYALGLDMPAASMVINALCILAIVFLLWRFTYREDRSPLFAFLGPFFYICFPVNVFWSTSGLETTFYSALLLLAFHTYTRAPSRRQHLTTGIILFAGAITRVEGVVFYLVFLLAEGIVFLRHRDRSHRQRLVALSVGMGLFLLFLVIRYAYFGYLLPNTYYAKMGGGWTTIRNGLRYVKEYVLNGALGIWGACFLLPYSIRMIGWVRNRSYLLALVIVLGMMALVVKGGGNNLPLWRYLAPSNAFIAYLAAECIADLYHLARPRIFKAGRLALLLLLSVLFSCGPAYYVFCNDHVVDFVRNNEFFYRIAKFHGLYLREALDPKQCVAINAMPFLAYYYDGCIVDMLGLVDVHIAHRSVPMGVRPHGHEKGDGEYVLRREPDVVFYAGTPFYLTHPLRRFPDPKQLVYLSDLELMSHPEFLAAYEPFNVRVGKVVVHFLKRKQATLRSVDTEAFWAEHGDLMQVRETFASLNAIHAYCKQLWLGRFLMP